MCAISDMLDNLIVDADVEKKSAYTTGNTALILGVSQSSVILLCDDWIPEDKKGLECYMVGTHRRIPHHALLAWLKLNTYRGQ